MTLIAVSDRAVAPVTDGEIAAINLESARRAAWARFARTRASPGAAEAVAVHERLAGYSSAILAHRTDFLRLPRNSGRSTTPYPCGAGASRGGVDSSIALPRPAAT